MPKPADRPCAYCGQASRVPAHDPFCSAGCQDRDLLRWLDGGYAIPASDHDDELSDATGLDKGSDDGLEPRPR